MVFRSRLKFLILGFVFFFMSCSKNKTPPETELTIEPHETLLKFSNNIDYSVTYDLAQPVTFKVEVLSPNPYENTPIMGDVYFYDLTVSDTNVICTPAPISNGIAECVVPYFNQAGLHKIKALYQGNDSYKSSESIIDYNTYTKGTHITLDISPGKSIYARQTAILTATLNYEPWNNRDLEGKFEFFYAGNRTIECDKDLQKRVKSSEVKPTNVHICKTSFLSSGRYTIGVRYSEDSVYGSAERIDILEVKKVEPQFAISVFQEGTGTQKLLENYPVCINLRSSKSYDIGNLKLSLPRPKYKVHIEVLGKSFDGDFENNASESETTYNVPLTKFCSDDKLTAQGGKYTVTYSGDDDVYEFPKNFLDQDLFGKITSTFNVVKTEEQKLQITLTPTRSNPSSLKLNEVGTIQICLNENCTSDTNIEPSLGCSDEVKIDSWIKTCSSIPVGTDLKFYLNFIPNPGESDLYASSSNTIDRKFGINYAECTPSTGCSVVFYNNTDSPFSTPIIDETSFKVVKVSDISKELLLPTFEPAKEVRTGFFDLQTHDSNHIFKCYPWPTKDKPIANYIKCENFVPFADKFSMQLDSKNGGFTINSIEITNNKKPSSTVVQCGYFGMDDSGTSSNYTTLQRMYDCSKRVENYAGRGNGQPNGAIDAFTKGNLDSMEKSWFLVSCEDTKESFCTWLSPIVPNADKLSKNSEFRLSIPKQEAIKDGGTIILGAEIKPFIDQKRILWSARSKRSYNFFSANGPYALKRTEDCDGTHCYQYFYDTYQRIEGSDQYITPPKYGASQDLAHMLCPPYIDNMHMIRCNYFIQGPDDASTAKLKDTWRLAYEMWKLNYDLGRQTSACDQNNQKIKGPYEWQMPSYPVLLMITGGTIMSSEQKGWYCEPQDGLAYKNGDMGYSCLTTKDEFEQNQKYFGLRAASIIPGFVDSLWSSSAADPTAAWAYASYTGGMTSHHPYDWDAYVRCISPIW